MSHNYVKCLDCVKRNLASAPLESLFQSIERYLLRPFDSYPEDPVSAFSRQGNFQFNCVISDWQRISCVHVVAAIEDWLSRAKDSPICLNHGLDNVAVYFAWALVWLNAHLIMVNISSWHGDLEMIGTEQDWATIATYVGSSRANKCGHI